MKTKRTLQCLNIKLQLYEDTIFITDCKYTHVRSRHVHVNIKNINNSWGDSRKIREGITPLATNAKFVLFFPWVYNSYNRIIKYNAVIIGMLSVVGTLMYCFPHFVCVSLFFFLHTSYAFMHYESKRISNKLVITHINNFLVN